MTSFNILVAKKEDVTISLQLCAPYPSGSVTATARPIMTRQRFLLRPDFYVQGSLPPGYQLLDSDIFNVYIGDTVPATITWDANTERWSSTERPTVPLSASYSQETGIASITVPFGTSFQRLPADEFDPGYSPRTYIISAVFNDVSIATGTVDIAENVNSPPPAEIPRVCSFESASGAGSAPGSQAASPWVVEG